MPSPSTHSTSHQQEIDRLRRLHDAGVSIWLDTLSRDLLAGGVDLSPFLVLLGSYFLQAVLVQSLFDVARSLG